MYIAVRIPVDGTAIPSALWHISPEYPLIMLHFSKHATMAALHPEVSGVRPQHWSCALQHWSAQTGPFGWFQPSGAASKSQSGPSFLY